MELSEVGLALQRVVTLFEKNPSIAKHADPPATARWMGGLVTKTSHPDGDTVFADLPDSFGGAGTYASPSWLIRAAAASCAATAIVMAAELKGIKLTQLEVTVGSQSDTRGNFAMSDNHGRCVEAAFEDFDLVVRISAENAAADALHQMASNAIRCSSTIRTIEEPRPVRVHVEVT